MSKSKSEEQKINSALQSFPERRELYEEGLTDEEIGEKVGVSKGAIRGWRSRRNLDPNEYRVTVENHLIKKYLNDCRMKKQVESTVKGKKQHLAKFERFLDKPLEKCRVRDVNKFLNKLSEKNLASSTIARYLSTIRRFYRYVAIECPEIKVPELRRISPKEFRPQPWENIERKPLSRLETRKLIQAPDSLRNSLLISMIYHCILRAGDAADLKVEQVDTDNRKLTNLVRKGNKVDSVPYPQKLDRAIGQWISKVRKSYVNSKGSPYFFVSKYGKKLTVTTIREIVRIAAEKAGIQGVVYEKPNGDKIWKVFTHILRITGATHAIEDGVSPVYLQKIMSHEDLKTTLHYAKPAEDKIFDSVRKNFDGV